VLALRAGQARVGVTLLGADLLVQALVQVFGAEVLQLLLTSEIHEVQSYYKYTAMK
jgi:hypothetical protein